MSIFSDIPLERLAAVFMRRDPKGVCAPLYGAVMSCGVGRLLGEYDVGKGSWPCENVVADAGELATSCVSTWLVSFYRFWPTGSDTNNGTSGSTQGAPAPEEAARRAGLPGKTRPAAAGLHVPARAMTDALFWVLEEVSLPRGLNLVGLHGESLLSRASHPRRHGVFRDLQPWLYWLRT